MPSRRDVLAGLAATLALPRPVSAQPATRPRRVAVYLSAAAVSDAVVEALREHGWVEDTNLTISRWSDRRSSASS